MSRNRLNEVVDDKRTSLAWMCEQIRAGCSVLVPSAEDVLLFVKNTQSLAQPQAFARLTIRAAMQVISSESSRARRLVVDGASGRAEVECDDPDRGVTVYCHQNEPVSCNSIDYTTAARPGETPEHVIFVTTDPIDPTVWEYAIGRYQLTGVEFAILDCIGFLRHFLHLFHRHRGAFLDAYQALVLAEPDSAVSFELKQAFLALRQAAVVPAAES
jgi:hypothetical protein